MSRYKNLLNTLAMTFVAYCVASVVWVVYGYTLAFGPDKAGLIGGLDFFLLSGITPTSLEGTIPTNVFALFQMTFACITVALVLGSIVERMKFSAWIVFTVLWVTSSTARSPTGCGARAGWRRWALWISRAARSCT